MSLRRKGGTVKLGSSQKQKAMRNSVTILAAAVLLVLTTRLVAQTPSSAPAEERKVTTRVDPVYPDLAKKMHIHGVVRIEAIVRSNGAVKSKHRRSIPNRRSREGDGCTRRSFSAFF